MLFRIRIEKEYLNTPVQIFCANQATLKGEITAVHDDHLILTGKRGPIPVLYSGMVSIDYLGGE
jgi:hypothetical protein